MSEMYTNTTTDTDKYILNGVEVTPNEFIDIVTNLLEAQHSRLRRREARIAELEGKIDQLTAHSDIERQDDNSSDDTQKETFVYGKESEE